MVSFWIPQSLRRILTNSFHRAFETITICRCRDSGSNRSLFFLYETLDQPLEFRFGDLLLAPFDYKFSTWTFEEPQTVLQKEFFPHPCHGARPEPRAQFRRHHHGH